MAEPKEPKRPLPGTPGAPLPRLWKAQPDEEPEPEEEPSKKKGKKARPDVSIEPKAPPKTSKKAGAEKKARDAKKPKSGKDGEGKSVLIEETPYWERIETRQTVRLVVGGVLSFIILTTFFVVAVRFLSDKPAEDQPEPSAPQEMLTVAPSTAPTRRERDEEEARILFERAREVARNKNTGLAVVLLKNVTNKYPTSTSAAEAKQALERPAQNLPLFLDAPAVVASAADRPRPKPEPPKAAVAVVSASKTRVSTTNAAEANLVLPANPAEPPRAVTPGPQPSAAPARPMKALPKGFRPRQGTDVHDSGWPMEIVGDRDGAPMVLIPGATFIQGRDDADSNEAPSHQVVLGTFYIDRHEVTVRQFNLFEKESGKRNDRVRALAKDPALAALDQVEDRPVVMVSARDAKDFADWAGKFLPTEAQWEAAARTPDGRIYPWGPEPPTWSKPRTPRQIDPVMSFPLDVSPYGAFDLSGNAWEWTKDWYDSRYYNGFRNAPANNPAGPTRPKSQQLVVKGGGRDWTVSKREGLRHDVRYPYLGFRCALQVEGAGNAFEPPPSAAPPAPGVPAPGTTTVIPF